MAEEKGRVLSNEITHFRNVIWVILPVLWPLDGLLEVYLYAR